MSVLTAAKVGERLSYAPRTVREYARAGKLPLPIDPTLTPHMWRWSVDDIERYESGNWKPGQPRPLAVAS